MSMGIKIYPKSVIEYESTTYFLARNEKHEKILCVEGKLKGLEGEHDGDMLCCPLNAKNAEEMRRRLPWLVPGTLGLRTSAGCGDRLGLATPGHLRALESVGGEIAPILAQQSMRENARTLRTPQQVMDDAMWGILESGWIGEWGADADHLKTLEDVTLCTAAGYTFFTVDPYDYVDNDAQTAPLPVLEEKASALDWRTLDDSLDALVKRYQGKTFQLGKFELTFTRELLLRAVCKYGNALAHAKRMYDHARGLMADRAFEMEISVDETDTPTSPLEHFLVASELKRMGVDWVSLAPRFIGRFEKGVDYIGDLAIFEAEVEKHAAVMKYFNTYKLSIHSGSDKFTIYPILAKYTDGLVHLKTAGTSYLEALRVMAVHEPAFFRSVMEFAEEHYEADRASYHVSANLEHIPGWHMMADSDLVKLLDHFDARQVLHVTFGSALQVFGKELLAYLDQYEDEYGQVLETHFVKHLAPFVE
ncbi:MAG: hypothetical protein JW750_08755 [Anaerolineaceae bacterium]|nr:hypothetical protein [Anaerolineaceae bacterium]